MKPKPKLESLCPSNAAACSQLVESHMRLHYRKGLDEMEISDVPGYWRDREPRMHAGHPLHGCLGCSGPFRATYTYYDPPRRDGLFASRTRTWAILKNSTVSPLNPSNYMETSTQNAPPDLFALVAVTMSELYGPVECKKCTCQAWTIWVTPEEKERYTFVEIYKRHGEARCDQCGPPDSANSTLTTINQPHQ